MADRIKQAVPKLRFPGFTGEWEVKKLGDVARTVNGLMYSPKNIRDSGVLVLRSSNIQHGQLDFRDCVYVQPDLRYNASKKGDVLICVRNGSQALIGKNVYIDKELPDTTHGAFMTVLRSAHNKYISQLFQTDKYYSQVSADLGARINSINNSQLLKYKFTFPSEEEQEKIAGFLGVVDERIAAVEKKVELLKQYKKGAMQKIFSQKLRFKDESGNDYPAWQTKKLSEISFKENSTVSANEIEGKSGDYKVFGAAGYLQTLDRYDQDEEYIAIVKDGAGVGRIGIYEPKSSVLGTLNIIKPQKGINNRYLYALLGTIDFAKYSTGSTIPHVYFKDYAKEKFGIPTMEEQRKIADFLTGLDNKIKLTEEKLAQAKTYKKSLLQRMFV